MCFPLKLFDIDKYADKYCYANVNVNNHRVSRLLSGTAIPKLLQLTANQSGTNCVFSVSGPRQVRRPVLLPVQPSKLVGLLAALACGPWLMVHGKRFHRFIVSSFAALRHRQVRRQVLLRQRSTSTTTVVAAFLSGISHVDRVLLQLTANQSVL